MIFKAVIQCRVHCILVRVQRCVCGNMWFSSHSRFISRFSQVSGKKIYSQKTQKVVAVSEKGNYFWQLFHSSSVKGLIWIASSFRDCDTGANNAYFLFHFVKLENEDLISRSSNISKNISHGRSFLKKDSSQADQLHSLVAVMFSLIWNESSPKMTNQYYPSNTITIRMTQIFFSYVQWGLFFPLALYQKIASFYNKVLHDAWNG